MASRRIMQTIERALQKSIERALPIGLLLGALGCGRRESAAPVPAPSPSSSVRAADRLLPGELAEGPDRPMGLAIPRDMHLLRVFDDSAIARGRVAAEAVANYVRKRVDAQAVEIGTGRTVFPKAHVKGQPERKLVRIDVTAGADSTELLLHDITPPEVPVGLSEEERWRKAGVVPGKPFDPSAL
jgi:hypothetical protein